MQHKTHPLMILMALILTPVSQAADFCVTNASELHSALFTAQSNGQADHIKLAPGSYTGSFNYNAAANEIFDLSISGGWTPFFDTPCAFEGFDAFETVLDGDSTDLVLRLLPEGGADMEVRNLTIINGQSTVGVVGGLDIFSTTEFGLALVERVAFINNTGEFIAALRILNGYRMTVRNSLFIINKNDPGSSQSSTSTAFISNNINPSAKGIYFNNNTVLNNTSLGANGTQAGIKMSRTGTEFGIYIANNLFHNNDGYDFVIPTTSDIPHLMYNNNYQSFFGVISNDIQNSGNFTEVPLFDQPGFFDYTPAWSSGEINAGRNPPSFIPVPTPFGYEWQLGTTDIAGQQRVQDGRVDVGAFEAAPEVPIFADDFE